jgi:hypothetical protein
MRVCRDNPAPRRQHSHKIIQILGKAKATLGFLYRLCMDMKRGAEYNLHFHVETLVSPRPKYDV